MLKLVMEGMDLRKICITASLFYSSFAMGIMDIFLAPTLIEFVHSLHSSVGLLNTIHCLSYATCLVAAFGFGIAYTKVNRNSIVPTALLLVALSVVALAFADSVLAFTVILNVVLGGKGAFVAAEMTWLKELWKEKAGPYIQGNNFLRSLGHLVTPWIFAPFLPAKQRLHPGALALTATAEEETTTETMTGIMFPTGFTTFQSEDTTEESSFLVTSNNSSLDQSAGEYRSNLLVPFEILGALIALSALFQFLTYICFDLKPDPADDVKENTNEIVPFSFKRFKRQLPLIIFITFAYAGAGAWNFYTLDLLPTFAYFSELRLSEMSAADLLGITNIFYSLGAFAGIFLNLKFSPRDILIGNAVLMGLGSLLLLHAVSGGLQDLAWYSCIIIGLGFSTTFPCVAAYGQLSMKFDTVVGAVVLIGYTVIIGVGQIGIGETLETFPNIFIYSNLVFVPIVLLSLWGFKSFLHRAQEEDSVRD